MPIINAVGTSLVAVYALFGVTTAFSYAISSFVAWPLAGVFVAGGIAGGQVGCLIARRMSAGPDTLKTLFASLIFVVATYMIIKNVRST